MAVCDAQLELLAFVVVVVVVVANVEEVVDEVTGGFETDVGNAVGRDEVTGGFETDVGNAVGREVGKPADTGGGDDTPPHPFPTLIATSAQFQNCSGTPRPSGGIL